MLNYTPYRIRKPHDPSGGSRKRSIKLQLDADDELLNTSTLSIVDDAGALLTEVAAGDFLPLQLNDVEIGLVNGLWIVNFWPRYGFPNTLYNIQLRPFFLSGLPGVPGDDITVKLFCKQG